MQYSSLEKAVHIIIILIGSFLTYLASTLSGFMQDLLLGLGTNLIVVTIVFSIFNYFQVGSRNTTIESENSTSKKQKEDTTPIKYKNILQDRKDSIEDPLFPRNYDNEKKGVKDGKK